MGVGSICGLIGTLLSIITLVLITVASIVPRFVDVYLVSDAEQIEEDNTVAGIGIFQSFYDSDRVDPEVLDASGAPVDEFTSPTPDFNLLFRARENFLVDILPVNAEVAADLAAAVNNSAVEALILSLIQPVIDIQFDNCEQYLTEAVTQTTALFAGLQNQLAVGQPSVLEGAIFVITETLVETFNTALQAIILFTNSNPAPGVEGFENPLELFFTGVVSNVAVACGTDLVTALDAAQAGCFSTVLAGTEIGQLTDLVLDELGSLFGTCEDETALDCLALFDFNFDVVGLGAAQTFASTPNICTALTLAGCNAATTGLEYVLFVAGILSENEDLELVAFSFGLFLQLDNFDLTGILQGRTTAVDAQLVTDAVNPTIPEFFVDDYDPCTFILLLDAVTVIPAINGTCTFANYFAGASVALETAGSDLAGLVGDLGLLYGGCAGASPEPADCPGIFATSFVSLGVGFDFEGANEFLPAGLQACEDELTDLEKVEEAQNLLIGSYPFYFISTIAAVVAVALASSATFLYGIAAASSFLAGILTLTALLVVQSAPIYDEVGEEPNGEDVETFFVSGPVQLLAIMCFLLMFVSGGFFVGASILLCLEGDSSDEDIEVKGDKQDVAVYAAAADAEPVPAKENPTVTDVGTGKDVSI